MKDAALRDRNKFRKTAVAIFSDHLNGRAKLFGPALAKSASTAGREIMDADSLAGFLYNAGHFMPERDRQTRDRRNARAVMRIGMANASGFDANQNIARTDWRDPDLLRFERRIGLDETNGFHAVAAALWAAYGLALATYRPTLRIAKRLQREANVVYASFTKYFPGNCLTRRLDRKSVV